MTTHECDTLHDDGSLIVRAEKSSAAARQANKVAPDLQVTLDLRITGGDIASHTACSITDGHISGGNKRVLEIVRHQSSRSSFPRYA